MGDQDRIINVPLEKEDTGKLTPNSKKLGEEDDKYKSEAKEKASFGDYLRIFSYATKWDIVLLSVASLASIGAGTTLPLMNIVFGNLVGSFAGYSGGSDDSSEIFNAAINQQTLYLVYIFIGKFSLCYISMFSFRITGIRISAAIRLAYLRALFSQSIGALDKLPSGQASSVITTSANTLQIGISEKLSLCLQFISLLVAAYVVAFRYSWQLTLAASSIVLFVLIVFSAIIPVSIKFQKSMDHANEKASSIASEVFSSIRMVVACGAEKRVAKTYSRWVEEARRRGLKLAPTLGLQFSPIFFSIYADFALTFWFGVKLYLDGHFTNVSTIIIVLMSVMMSVMSIGNIIAPIMAAGKAASAASSFFAVIDAPRINQQGLKDPDASAEEDITFENVTFAYPSRPHVKIMDNFNACFEKGKLTAIVGPSGSGKSTIVGLIERWYEIPPEGTTKIDEDDENGGSGDDKVPIPLSGEIKAGEHNLRDLDLKWWRSQIGFVQQEPFLFNDTIFENVSYGLIGSRFENEPLETKRALVEEACREAFADEFINKLPMGYETQVGDSGIKLSGGQRQRLAIARSIIKRPTVLIFDEATSAIDVRGEQIVQEALDRVAKNRTTITIAHRLSTIKKADKIIVMSKGTVVEQGTHEGLLTNPDGVYYNLVNAQNLTLGDEQDLAITKTVSPDTVREAVTTETVKDTESSSTEENPYKMRGFFGSFGFLLVEQKAHVNWLLLTLLGAIGSATAFPVQAYLFAQLVGVFQNSQTLREYTSHWSLMFVALACSLAFTYGLVGWAASSLSTHASCHYRQEYFECITEKPIKFFDAEENSSGTLTSRVANDPTQIQELLGVNMAMVLIAVFSVIGCISISYAFGWKLTLVAMFATMPIIAVASFNRIRFEIQFEKMNSLVFAESSKFAGEAFSAVRTVMSMTLEDVICDRYAVLLKGHVDAARKKARFTTLVFALSDSVNLLCMALTFWYGGRLTSSHEYDIIQFLVVYIAIIQGSESAGQWCSFGPNIALVTAASNRILSLRNGGPKTRKAPLADLANGDCKGGAEISFQDVHFKYPTRDIPIFAGLNLNIKKGQFAGLVGASGCGKTTVVSLLEQFYQVQKGQIYLDGVNINDIDVSEYRKAFSLVAQEPTLFQGTIRENILLAVDEKSVTDEDIHQACRDAEIHDFITSLPESYNTDIGSRGVALSGGQKQRIAIARALIRNPRVLLLDEATSSLDSESEKLVQAAFERAGKGRTMVVVAHRLATVQNADVIFVLGSSGEGARVLEKGTHGELVAKRGIYFQMCHSQALDR